MEQKTLHNFTVEASPFCELRGLMMSRFGFNMYALKFFHDDKLHEEMTESLKMKDRSLTEIQRGENFFLSSS